jgi:hypothetical protein
MPSHLFRLLLLSAVMPLAGIRAQIAAAPGNIAISELNYQAHPRTAEEALEGGSAQDDDYDFIEFLNLTGQTVSLAGCSVTVGITWNAIGSPTVAPNGRVVIVRNLNSFRRRYGGPGPGFTLPPTITVIGEFSQNLSNSGEQLVFRNASNQVIHDFTYFDSGSWPGRANGRGATLEVLNTSGNYNDSRNWRSSREYGGTPGTAGTGPLTSVVINEILAHSDAPFTDFIELYNPTANPVNVSGWIITDRSTGNNVARFVIPANTTLAPGAYKVYTTFDFGAYNPASPLGFSEFGESIYLLSAVGGKPLAFEDDVNYLASDVNTSLGRHVNSVGGTDFAIMPTITSGAANPAPLVGPVVISELMYGPQVQGYEFIELHNPTATAVPLWDAAAPPTSTNRFWAVADAVRFQFAAGDTLQPGEYVLVTQTNPALFRAQFNIPLHVRIFGPYTGNLDNAGETVRLTRPGSYDSEIRQSPTVQVDRVSYSDLAPWPLEADGLGPSLERIQKLSYGNDPANWRPLNWHGSPGGPSQLDEDGDGVPDNWEYAIFVTTSHQDFLTSDRDGDTVTCRDEYVLGTSPLQADAPLRVRLAPSGPGWELRYPTVLPAHAPGYYGRDRRYQVRWAPVPGNSGWEPVPGLEAVAASGGDNTHLLDTSAPQAVFQVEVQIP